MTEKNAQEENDEMITFNNNSFNIYEHYHNCMIVSVKLKNWKMAHEYGKKLNEIIPENFKLGLSVLIKCIAIERNLKDFKISMQEGIHFIFIDVVLIFLLLVPEELQKIDQILVFPDNDRLSKIFPSFQLGFSFNPNLVFLF